MNLYQIAPQLHKLLIIIDSSARKSNSRRVHSYHRIFQPSTSSLINMRIRWSKNNSSEQSNMLTIEFSIRIDAIFKKKHKILRQLTKKESRQLPKLTKLICFSLSSFFPINFLFPLANFGHTKSESIVGEKFSAYFFSRIKIQVYIL